MEDRKALLEQRKRLLVQLRMVSDLQRLLWDPQKFLLVLRKATESVPEGKEVDYSLLLEEKPVFQDVEPLHRYYPVVRNVWQVNALNALQFAKSWSNKRKAVCESLNKLEYGKRLDEKELDELELSLSEIFSREDLVEFLGAMEKVSIMVWVEETRTWNWEQCVD